MGVKAEAKRLGDIKRANLILEKQQSLDTYNANPNKCALASCTNNLTYAQVVGSKPVKFCCRSCSNKGVYRHTEESKQKVSKTLSETLQKKSLRLKIRNCKNCNCLFCPVTVSTKRFHAICSLQCKTELRAKDAVIHGRSMKDRGSAPGWAARTKAPSYPENYFIKIFVNKNLTDYVKEKKVGRWFIDFAFEKLMLAVEIDGKQHDEPERKANDERKDEHLKKEGWNVIRIRWHNPINQKNKDLLYPQIDKLLSALR